MTCYEMGTIQSYIDGELSREERKQFIKHLDKCKECQNLLIELTELNQWENSTLAEEKLHETPEINIDVEKAWQTFNSHNQSNNVLSTNQMIEKKQGVFSNMNKKSKRFMYTAVAAVGIFTTAMIPQVQVAATNIASYFVNEVLNDAVVNEGSKDENGVQQEGMLKGQFIPIDEKITDQGITVHFKELYVADARISVHYRVEKADGTLMPFEFDINGLDIKSDGKVNGQQEKNPEYNIGNGMFSQLSFIQSEDNLPFELMSEGKKLEHVGIRDKDRPEGVITFVEGPEGKGSFKQPLTLDVNINKIGKIAGSWKGQLQINPEKVNK
ncbi:DUF4179 domain-containing protein [Bacillus mobilis]|uniref:DUF4179 domain-containing protein n=1 Tax=Bacillus cereus group TaxID=86661 RepID=UPI000BFBB55A|nr:MULTISPECIES: DUF4179 domain-containing protein [Bacillus cereus group]MED0940522.1 DUF4179 domain-containing protein [Bacillus mobilis]MED0948756.1 DUF4179 domain-containing protein [Bacillus mobilis]MED0999294.1 DUF4179 domain-containing protein [Bacillus mobilis]MED1004829.1 DUF4179 domain-containing protein [Bacillus mobilis]PGU39562.1 hypothetical protein COD91_24925 [Bacillus cereus]